MFENVVMGVSHIAFALLGVVEEYIFTKQHKMACELQTSLPLNQNAHFKDYFWILISQNINSLRAPRESYEKKSYQNQKVEFRKSNWTVI